MAKAVDTRAIVLAYIAERGNQSAAARRLEIDRGTVRQHLRTELGQQLVAELTAEALDQYRVDAMRVVGEMAAIGFADLPAMLNGVTKVAQLANLEPHQRAAISEVTLADDGETIERIKLHPKIPALQLLAAYAGVEGLGADGAGTSSRPELGGLHIIGGPVEANQHGNGKNGSNGSNGAGRRTIPKPERLD